MRADLGGANGWLGSDESLGVVYCWRPPRNWSGVLSVVYFEGMPGYAVEAESCVCWLQESLRENMVGEDRKRGHKKML
jgi:hypothetical protein